MFKNFCALICYTPKNMPRKFCGLFTISSYRTIASTNSALERFSKTVTNGREFFILSHKSELRLELATLGCLKRRYSCRFGIELHEDRRATCAQ